MSQVGFEEVLEHIFSDSNNTKQQGDAFEKATVYYLKNDPLYSDMFSDVWLWKDSPTCTGQDIGIDVVARDAHDGTYWAIQCKCFQEDATLSYKALATFFAKAGAPDEPYKHFMIVDTANAWTKHLQEVAAQYDTVHIGADDMRESDLDWSAFLHGKEKSERTFHEARPHQKEAIEKTVEGFKNADRGKLIMACGTGKTLTALRLVEEYCPHGMVLFLAPSISLVSQTLRAWANQSKEKMRPFVVCSDIHASNLEDIWDTSVADVPYPATTDPEKLAKQVKESQKDGELTVVFSTYQSIQVIIDAQKKGMREFDLCICDEAHRTTGVSDKTISREEQSAFTKVHDANMLKAKKRLYMTATPRIYSTNAIKKAHEESYEISSMDDVSKYGEEFYRLSFGRAVELGLLSDYRVIVLTVSETMASKIYQQSMFEEGGFDIPEVAKILGVWKGLATRGAKETVETLYQADIGDEEEVDYAQVVFPMQRAVAFTSTIAESERLANQFQDVVDAYIEKSGIREPLQVETLHVDGTMDSNTRKSRLRWLEENPGDEICRVLTNAKCLSEGIDVPDLDAVLFMKPRNSQVDIIQAVGRVMRKAPNKQFGYIILPVVVPAGMSPEAALDDDKAFAVVWQILQALRSHDERLDARINSLQFRAEGDTSNEFISISDFTDEDDEKLQAATQEKLALEWTDDDWQNAMEAKLVKKCGTRVYWDDWADDVAGIASRHISRIWNILETDPDAKAAFDVFLQGLRDSLNPGITEEQAVEMLAQHMITLPVFEALFGDESFASSNPVSIAMEAMLEILNEHKIEDREDDEILQGLYDSVRSRVSVVQTSAGRQAIIKELYEGFFSKAFKGTSEKMGIVYTPDEIVEFILRATDRMLKREFGQGLGDEGVHILDPFAGTGTFIADLIASDIISDEQLPYKYMHELHSNEILLLAYYIMTVNIEQAYHERMGGDYVPFNGAVLTDTFQMTEEGDTLDTTVFTQNSERVLEQNALDIRVIVGNPPYSVGQKSANDNNTNEHYSTLDRRIAETYANTQAVNKNSLYNSYIRAFRWASDRIGDNGIICFVTNGGWLESNAANGIRASLSKEFREIYVFNLRGNIRKFDKREGENVFGQGSMATIAITMLVKNKSNESASDIYYFDIGEYLTREKKLSRIKRAALNDDLDWQTIKPDRHNDWLNQRDDTWYEFAPMGMEKYKQPNGIFVTWSNGDKTQRDAWATNFSFEELGENMQSMIAFFNEECDRLKDNPNASKLIDNDANKISWSTKLIGYVGKGKKLKYEPWKRVLCQYRPFCKEWLYYDQELNERTYQLTRIFPILSNEIEAVSDSYVDNVVISIPGLGSPSEFSALVYGALPALMPYGGNQCFPLYWYEKSEDLGGLFESSSEEYIRHDAITDETLSIFRNAYPNAFGITGNRKARTKKDGGTELTKEDIFYYIYGILHSTEYRDRFASNLKKELPRIPLAEDFRRFSEAGRKLAYWHLNYETVEPYTLEEVGDKKNPGRTEKITFGKCKKDEDHPKGQDMTILKVAENLTLLGVPLQAYDYIVNGKSAIGWLMDRYKVATDKASGIVNDPNEYSDDPRYIVDLVKRVIRVSLETLEIIGSLPPLKEKAQPLDWPIAWKVSE